MCALQLLACYPYVHDTLNWRMVADKKSQLKVQDRPRIWKAPGTDVNSTKHANIVIFNEPFQHIYWINIATLESAMNDNSFWLPSCSDSRRRSRRLTTNINFSCVRHFVPPTTTCTYWHHITLSSRHSHNMCSR